MSTTFPEVRPPTDEETDAAASTLGLTLSDDALARYQNLIADSVALFDQLSGFGKRETTRPIEPASGSEPGSTDDPFNAFVTKFRLQGAANGPLTDLDIGLKDNIPVAGVRMTAGSPTLVDCRPDVDATVVSRLLGAGGTITGKLNMDEFAFTGTGETGFGGPVLNPRSPGTLAGGSSGGAAAAVAAGAVDVALGTDAGGSVRRPAAACGCVGHKPTYGLVPYTGIVPTCPSMDHVGPVARTVGVCTRVLEVIAGPDRFDPRQALHSPERYIDSLEAGEDEPVVGVLEQGFSAESSANSAVRAAIDRLDEAGVEIRDVSVPLHERAKAIWSATFVEEATATIRSGPVGGVPRGRSDTHLVETFAAIRGARPDDLPHTLTATLLLGQYLTDAYDGLVYSAAQELRETLTAAYDAALEEVDVLALPAVQRTAEAVPDDSSIEGSVRRGTSRTTEGVQNRAPFNATGHPATTVPCGSVEGLPVGMMFVGERFADATVLDAARLVEETREFDA